MSSFLSSSENNNAPIGVFDSGVGGLSIAQCIQQQLPYENLLYMADTLHAPYGEKSATFIQHRVLEISHWFIKQGAKAIVVACNTATVNAVDKLRAQVNIPIIGVEPAIKPAAHFSKSKKVAILVTKATAENQRFLALVEQFKNNSTVYIQPCPGLVELIEQDKKSSMECRALLIRYLEPLINAGVDTLVLGCTHYPLVKQQISEICGTDIIIMETAKPVTEQLRRQLASNALLNPNKIKGTRTFFSSKTCMSQQQLFSHILRDNLILQRFE